MSTKSMAPRPLSRRRSISTSRMHSGHSPSYSILICHCGGWLELVTLEVWAAPLGSAIGAGAGHCQKSDYTCSRWLGGGGSGVGGGGGGGGASYQRPCAPCVFVADAGCMLQFDVGTERVQWCTAHSNAGPAFCSSLPPSLQQNGVGDDTKLTLDAKRTSKERQFPLCVRRLRRRKCRTLAECPANLSLPPVLCTSIVM